MDINGRRSKERKKIYNILIVIDLIANRYSKGITVIIRSKDLSILGRQSVRKFAMRAHVLSLDRMTVNAIVSRTALGDASQTSSI